MSEDTIESSYTAGYDQGVRDTLRSTTSARDGLRAEVGRLEEKLTEAMVYSSMLLGMLQKITQSALPPPFVHTGDVDRSKFYKVPAALLDEARKLVENES